MAHRLLRNLRGGTVARFLLQKQNPITGINYASTRTYISEMRKEAFEGHILRLLRNEIEYELDRSPPATPSTEFQSFVIDEKPGEQWFRLKKRFGDNEEIKVDATMFDAVFPVKKPEGGVPGDDVQLHISMIVDVFKGEGDQILEFVCSVWPETFEIRKVYTRRPDQAKNLPYAGPEFKELDDRLQESLYDFLEARGINDDLAVFLHQYVKNKDRSELLRWMDKLKAFIEKKDTK